jgi:hypothetical protein
MFNAICPPLSARVYNTTVIIAHGVEEATATIVALVDDGYDARGTYHNVFTDGRPYHVFAGRWVEADAVQADCQRLLALFPRRVSTSHAMTVENLRYADDCWRRITDQRAVIGLAPEHDFNAEVAQALPSAYASRIGSRLSHQNSAPTTEQNAI